MSAIDMWIDVRQFAPRRAPKTVCACEACCAVDPRRRALRGGLAMQAEIFAKMDRPRCRACRRPFKGGVPRCKCKNPKGGNPDA